MNAISICIPTYNRSDLLRQTLVSVTRQTVKPHEILVVDNCSEDDTEAVARSFDGVQYRRNERNLGLAGNWNRCLSLASGDYVSILHSDDLISPDWVKEMSSLIASGAADGAGAIFLPVFTIDIKNRVGAVNILFGSSRMLPAGESIRTLWSKNHCGVPASGGVLFRRDIFREIGLFDERLTTETDALMILRLLNRYPVYFLRKLLYAYRIHPFQTFDREKQAKGTEKKLNVARNHMTIVRDFYNAELRDEYKGDFFCRKVMYMFAAIGICNGCALRFQTARRYFEQIAAVFPDVRFGFLDYLRILMWIEHYFRRLALGKMKGLCMRGYAAAWIT